MLNHYRISIIANPVGQAWNLANFVYDYIKETIKKTAQNDSQSKLSEKELQQLDELVELTPLEVIYFPDGEFKPKITRNVRRRNCVFIHDSNLDPSVWSKQLTLVNKALRTSSAHEIVNVLPYFKWARQDKKDESRVPISAKDDGQNITSDHTRIITVDIHNDAIPGFFDYPFESLPAFPVLYRAMSDHGIDIPDNSVLINTSQMEDGENLPDSMELLQRKFMGPDEGSINRFRKYIPNTGIDVAMVDKFRKVTGKLGESYGVLGADKIKGNYVFFIDDIGASGSTLINGSKAAKNAGAKGAGVYVTHPLFLRGLEKICKEFDIVLIGNTIQQPYIQGEGDLAPEIMVENLPEDIKVNLPKNRPIFYSDIARQFPPFKYFKLPENVRIVSFDKAIAETVYKGYIGESVSAMWDLSKSD